MFQAISILGYRYIQSLFDKEVPLMNEKEIQKHWQVGPSSFKGDMHQFQNWFDRTASLDQTISYGNIDFHAKILMPDICKQLGETKNKTCLEIGFGGGRILNAAAKVFQKANGIDIHDCFDMTSEFLKSQGVENFSLIRFEDSNDIADDSVDFIYSFIVFQHFGSIDVFYQYLDLIKRIMKKGGCGNLHLGKNIWNNNGYFLKPNLNLGTTCSTLYYNLDFVKKELESRNLKMISHGQMKKMPWSDIPSGQFFVNFKK